MAFGLYMMKRAASGKVAAVRGELLEEIALIGAFRCPL
jgi:hypothetical protein